MGFAGIMQVIYIGGRRLLHLLKQDGSKMAEKSIADKDCSTYLNKIKIW